MEISTSLISYKTCTKCKTTKPLSLFNKSRQTKDGYHPHCKGCQSENYRRRYRENPEKVRVGGKLRNMKHRNGITLDEYNELLASQAGVCAICKKPPKEKRRFSIDHDHITGQNRGLLCDKCNMALGLMEDNIKWLSMAIKYLEIHKGE